jgi:lipopolysaccharide/colanic/teichoic acid biosynthesis glycosyltransferase
MTAAKRALDVLLASTLLILVSPLMLLAAAGIALASPGPVFYRARRIGRDRRRPAGPGTAAGAPQTGERRQSAYMGVEFTLYKFRTMHVTRGAGAPITAKDDPRVFPFGALLRATKIDELPQLINVIKGDMSLVGPRPEAPEIVRAHYSKEDILTLQVPPGVTSPGSLYYYTHLEPLLEGDEVTTLYAERVLPIKLAVDRVYLKRMTLGYDLNLLMRTVMVIAGRCVGRKNFSEPPEVSTASLKELPHR